MSAKREERSAHDEEICQDRALQVMDVGINFKELFEMTPVGFSRRRIIRIDVWFSGTGLRCP